MKSTIKITDSAAGTTSIDIEGTIGVPEQWQFDDPAGRVATYEKFSRTLEAIARLRTDEIVVNIRSTGGDVGDAVMIHDALAATGAAVTTRCHGYVASAATIIAQAASEGRREISPSALYLVHNSVGSCEGNAAELERGVELLAKTDRRIAALYARRSGRAEEEFTALMAENNGNGRWLSPEETIAAGLADRIAETGGDAGRISKRHAARMRAAATADTLRLGDDIPSVPDAPDRGAGGARGPKRRETDATSIEGRSRSRGGPPFGQRKRVQAGCGKLP